MSSVEEFFLRGRLGEVSLAAEVLQKDELGVRELTEDAIDALVDEHLCLFVHSVAIGEHVILIDVRVHSQIQVVHLLDVRTVVAVSLACVRHSLHDPGVRRANAVDLLRNLAVVVDVLVVEKVDER